MNVTLSVDEQLLDRAREKLRATGKTINQEFREHLEHIVGDDDLEADIEFFIRTSGQGKPDTDWHWDRNEIYEERLR